MKVYNSRGEHYQSVKVINISNTYTFLYFCLSGDFKVQLFHVGGDIFSPDMILEVFSPIKSCWGVDALINIILVG